MSADGIVCGGESREPEREYSQVVASSCARAGEIVAARYVDTDALLYGARAAQETAAAWEKWLRDCNISDDPCRPAYRRLERDRPAFRFKMDESFGVDPALGHEVIGVYNETAKTWKFVKLPAEEV